VCIRVYSTRRTSVCVKDSDSLAPTAKWGLHFILEWSELYELRPELYEPLIGAGWLQETSGRPVKLRVVRLANLRLAAATALQNSFYFGSSRSGYMFTTFSGLYLGYIITKFGLHENCGTAVYGVLDTSSSCCWMRSSKVDIWTAKTWC
jgi:hypothetical protein